MQTSTERLMRRFGTFKDQKGFAEVRVNTARRQVNQLNEQEEVGIKLILGCGASDPTTGKDNGYAEHTAEHVRFAMYGQEGIPMIVTMPKIEIHDAITWIQSRLKGFMKHAKSRESQNCAIRRKGIAAMGQPFVTTVKNAGRDHVPMEVDMMFSKDSHHGIANLEKTQNRPGVVKITLELDGTVRGLYDRFIVDNDGLKMVSPEMFKLGI